MKIFAVVAIMFSIHSLACEDVCVDKSKIPIDCKAKMRDFALSVENYASAVESLNLQRLSGFREWLEENTNTHILCSVCDPDETHSSAYKDIFMSNYQLKSGIKALIKSKHILGYEDEFIANRVKEKYSIMRNGVAAFNK